MVLSTLIAAPDSIILCKKIVSPSNMPLCKLRYVKQGLLLTIQPGTLSRAEFDVGVLSGRPMNLRNQPVYDYNKQKIFEIVCWNNEMLHLHAEKGLQFSILSVS